MNVQSAIHFILNKLKPLETIEVGQYTLPSTVEFGDLRIRKVGKVVTIIVQNPTKLPAGANTITTLPEGWRPPVMASAPLIAPIGAITTNSTIASIRLTVAADGTVNVRNYRSTAITDSTNQSGVLTYIATQ